MRLYYRKRMLKENIDALTEKSSCLKMKQDDAI